MVRMQHAVLIHLKGSDRYFTLPCWPNNSESHTGTHPTMSNTPMNVNYTNVSESFVWLFFFLIRPEIPMYSCNL